MTKKSLEQVLKHFTFQDKDKALRKIEKTISDGKNNLHLLVDFDRTLTIGKDKDNRDFTSWNALTKLLPEEALAKQQALYKKYRPIEASGKMTNKQGEDWARQVLKIFVENEINLLKLEEDFANNNSIRSHTKAVFEACEALEIPIVILSAGIKQTIDIWSKNYFVYPTLTIATNLIVDKKGKIIGWDKDIIHVANKREKGHKNFSEIKNKRPNVILIGDAIEDADMADGDENILRIRINNPREDEALDQAAFANQTFEKFDLMINNGTLEPVLKILEHIK